MSAGRAGTRMGTERTVRQRQVLDLLARGRTNAEIAEALGISLDGAKWHVSEVITRLGVDSRDEAADYWRAENGLRRRLWRVARAALPGALWGRALAAAVLTAVVVGGAVIAVVVLSSGDDAAQADTTPTVSASATASATSTVSATPSASPTPDVIDGVTARTLTLGAPVSFPSGVLLSYFVAGYATDGGPAQSYWMYRSASGQLIRGTLPQPPSSLGSTYSVVGDAFSSALYAAVCTKGTCFDPIEPSADAQDRVYRSVDGGVSWQDVGSLPREAYFSALTVDGPVYYSWPNGHEQPMRFTLFPSGRVLKAPAPHAFLTTIGDGTLAWIDQDSGNWYSEDGSRLIWQNRGSALDGTTVIGSFGGSSYVRWAGSTGQPYDRSPFNAYLASFDASGKITELFSWSGNLDIRAVALIAPGILLGNVPLGASGQLTDGTPARYEPALFDLRTVQVHPMPEVSDGLAGWTRSRNEHAFVTGVLLGKFARVATGSDCLNLRETPSTTARSLACLHDGVLLRLRDEPSQTVGGAEWLSVDGPGAQHGWVSAQFVER